MFRGRHEQKFKNLVETLIRSPETSVAQRFLEVVVKIFSRLSFQLDRLRNEHP